MLYLVAVLDFVNEDFGWFKAGDVMLINNDGRISGDVARDFLFTFFIDKTSEATHINIMAVAHTDFNN